MTTKDFEEFMYKLFEDDKELRKREKQASTRRKRNCGAWDKIERELTKLQGSGRSMAFKTLKMFSVSESAIGTTMYDKLREELTENERKLLKL